MEFPSDTRSFLSKLFLKPEYFFEIPLVYEITMIFGGTEVCLALLLYEKVDNTLKPYVAFTKAVSYGELFAAFVYSVQNMIMRLPHKCGYHVLTIDEETMASSGPKKIADITMDFVYATAQGMG